MKKIAVLIVATVLWAGAGFSADSTGAAHAHGPYYTYYRPATVYYAPAPTVVYSPPPAVVYQPAARVVTRYRPILGRTVSRVRYGYAPVYYYP